jgi:polyphosphate kinase
VVTPVQKPELQAALRQILNVQIDNHRSVWDMQADGQYKQRHPKDKPDKIGVQETLIELAVNRLKVAEKGKKLKTKSARQKAQG